MLFTGQFVLNPVGEFVDCLTSIDKKMHLSDVSKTQSKWSLRIILYTIRTCDLIVELL